MQEILDAILAAIEDEVKAQKHYGMLADKAEDPEVKKFFEQLKMEEENHEKILRKRYEAFSKMLKTAKGEGSIK